MLIPPALVSRWERNRTQSNDLENFQMVYGQVGEIILIAVTFM